MAYGVEIINGAGVKILDTEGTAYYVSKSGTLSYDATGTTVTNFSKVSSLNYAYYLSDFFKHDYSERTNVTLWNSSTSYVVGDYVAKTSSVVANTLVYECLKDHSNVDPTATSNRGDNVYWRMKLIRNGYDRQNDALFSETEGENALVFFKLPSVNDKITIGNPTILNTGYPTGLAYEMPVLTNLSSLSYSIIRPLTDFTPTTGGYGMQVYDASGNTIHLTNEKFAHIDTFANRLTENSTVTSSSSTINWVCLPPFSIYAAGQEYNTQSNGQRFTNYIERTANTTWKNVVYTYNAGTDTYGDPAIIQSTFILGRMD